MDNESGAYETSDITVRIVRYSDGLIRVEKVEMLEPLADEIDDESLSAEDLLLFINQLAVYQYHRERSQNEPQPSKRESWTRKESVEQYQYRTAVIASMPRTGGVYAIRCSENKKVYVGATKNLKLRIKQHLYAITNPESNHPLQEDYSKYGLESIQFEIVESVDDCQKLSQRESFWINELGALHNGYNRQEPNAHHAWIK